MIKVLILSGILIFLALLALSIRLLFDKKAEFKCGSCISSSPELKDHGIGCGCYREPGNDDTKP